MRTSGCILRSDSLRDAVSEKGCFVVKMTRIFGVRHSGVFSFCVGVWLFLSLAALTGLPVMILRSCKSCLLDFFGSNDQCVRLVVKKDTELIDHHLNRLFQMRPHPFKHHHVTEFQWKESGPPADGQVLAVHAVEFAVLTHSVYRIRSLI